MTCLHVACKEGNLEMAKIFVNLGGFDIDVKDSRVFLFLSKLFDNF